MSTKNGTCESQSETSVGWMMVKENMDIHNGLLLRIKMNEIMLFAGKWMEVEIIMLNEIS
jgi:hypothetical protein